MRETTLSIDGVSIPATCVNTVIVGAGAAGMNCAVQLVHQWQALGIADPQERVLVVTGGLNLGASRMSGSDKQTYYKMGTSPRTADTAEDFAGALTGFGCCHGDTALIEGICSLRGFYHLVDVGVPFPRDAAGAFIGYKTDHDPQERATSAGPKTSKFMSECLQAQAEHLGVRILDKHPVLKLFTGGDGDDRRIVALLCADMARAGDDDPGLALLAAENWVLAAGGPGEIYQSTVYPRGQYGLHGAALEAGLEACNLTESQFGLASTEFRWNVSGTYMQVVPRIFSTDADGGDEREFLAEYFDDMPTMATNIFLKGYQWPFDAQRITARQSSLIDMAVHQQRVVHGRRVFMDFLRNPAGGDRWDAFDIDALAPEAGEYLRKAGAVQPAPIDRLEYMNRPAIEIYAEHGIDLHAQPLEIAVCAQHMNGGFAVDSWWRSSIRQTFIIGEMAGTHGVKRPGGSALNAGQVGALRAAEYIAHACPSETPDATQIERRLGRQLDESLRALRAMRTDAKPNALAPRQAMDEIRQRMTRFGAHLRSRRGAADALKEAVALYQRLRNGGLKIDNARGIPAAVRTVQQCLMHAAILKAICALSEQGAGSRGSHCILSEDGIEMHPALADPQTGRPYRFRPENEALRDRILHVTFNVAADDLFDIRDVPPRPAPTREIAFEPAWAEYREGKIYER